MRLNPSLLAALPALINIVYCQVLPYNPTQIFISPNDSDILYVFQPSASTASRTQLVALNISGSFGASNISAKVLTSKLPFLKDSTAEIGYSPTLSPSGTIDVYAGPCSSSSSLWVWSPHNASSPSSPSNGSWAEVSTTGSSAIGANFLASSFSFSTLVDASDSEQTRYVFGGMCPTETETNTTTWQSDATYSNAVLALTVSGSSAKISTSTSSGSSPIPEAGFTLTALTPIRSNSSSGVVSQSQNYVLLGGHTDTAFINMSTIGIFSLPEESWSYPSVEPPGSSGNTDLTAKSTSSTAIPDSRSGHTAVLSSDGSAIIVFGGWVGNVETAADPQLAILKLGAGFGGSADWQWEIPTTSGAGLVSGEGIYGHGAVMLPGDVMMVLGGNTIASTSDRIKRAGTGTQVYFLNTTSFAWSSSYTNPSSTGADSSSSSSSSSSTSNGSTNDKKVGLGAGLGIGLAAVAGAVGVYFWYCQRLRRKRAEAREKSPVGIDHGNGNGDFYAGDEPDMQERDAIVPRILPGGSVVSRSMGVERSGYGPLGHETGYEYDEAGTTIIPVPNVDGNHQVPRKPLNPHALRGYHQPSLNASTAYTGFDLGTSHTGHTRSNSHGTAGAIHPIYEADEDVDVTDARSSARGVESSQQQYESVPLVSPMEESGDPFRDPTPNSLSRNQAWARSQSSRGHLTPSPERLTPEDRQREVDSWVADWTAADAFTSSRNGRLSPSKDSMTGRTVSDLSERSAIAASGLLRNPSINARNNSIKTVVNPSTGSWNPFATLSSAPNWNGMHGNGTMAYDPYRTGNGNGNVSPTSIRSGPPVSSGSGTSTFNTAHTSQSNHNPNQGSSFTVLRAEGHSLLPRPKDMSREEGSPSKHKAAAFTRRKEGGWLGSLRRVFHAGDDEWVSIDGSSASDHSSPTRQNHSPSFSGNGSPTRTGYYIPELEDGTAPRRTVSASSAMLWRRKQGRDDWQDSVQASDVMGQRSNTLTGAFPPVPQGDGRGNGESNGKPNVDDEEWDIEKAVQSRLVQVMFTVPKDKLRVVNGGPADNDDDKSDAASFLDKGRESKGKSFEVPNQPQASVEPVPRSKTPLLSDLALAEASAWQPPPAVEEGIGSRIEGRQPGEVVGRTPELKPTSTPSRPGSPGRKSRVLEMVEKMERDKF